jgi:surface protein
MALQTPTFEDIDAALPARTPACIVSDIFKYLGWPFICTFKTPYPCLVTIPKIASTRGVTIDWGDGQIQHITQNGNIAHYYKEKGQFVVHMIGVITHIDFFCALSLAEISQWGCLRLTCCRDAFASCRNLRITARDVLDVSRVTDMSRMFMGCENINFDARQWNVSNVTDMSYMFRGCRIFNGNLSDWDVRKVITMRDMFNGCDLFNSNIRAWDVRNVVNFNSMFKQCVSFGVDLRNWRIRDDALVIDMVYECYNFKGPIGNMTIEKEKQARSDKFPYVN